MKNGFFTGKLLRYVVLVLICLASVSNIQYSLNKNQVWGLLRLRHSSDSEAKFSEYNVKTKWCNFR